MPRYPDGAPARNQDGRRLLGRGPASHACQDGQCSVRFSALHWESELSKLARAQADEAYYIGPAPSSESYLRKQAYVDICRKSGAQAVHPGYG